MLTLLPTYPRCESCEHAEEHGLDRCFYCGTPLTPNDSSIQFALKTYFQIRSLSLSNVQFCREILDGKLYNAATDNDHARVLFFLGPDWVGLEYGRVSPSAQTDLVDLVAERIAGWHSELLRWKALPLDQKIPVEYVQRQYGYMQLLAAYDEKNTQLTLRSFSLGDWMGVFAPPVKHNSSASFTTPSTSNP